MLSNKGIILSKFMESHKFLPVQGSQEWLNGRMETIGGSEISTIIGLNPYQNVKKLISQKIGLTTFTKSAPLWFGSIMEFVLQQYTEIIFDTKIYETGSVPFEKSKCIKYSPDGLAVINKRKIRRFIKDNDIEKYIDSQSVFDNTLDENKDELLILFEFKSPYMRIPKQGEIPIYYKPQPQLGLEVINICEASIFIESVFRFCSYEDIILENEKYNTRYHFDKKRYNVKPIAYSAFSLYYDSGNESKNLLNILKSIDRYHLEYVNDKFNLTNIFDKKIINAIMENIIDYRDIKIEYHDMYINNRYDYSDKDLYYFNKYNNINKFKAEIKNKRDKIISDGYEYIGHFCYKMFDININPVFKSDIINEKLLDKTKQVVNMIQECNKLDDKSQQKKLIDSFNYT